MSAVVTAFAFLTICNTASAAIHDYHDDYFFAVGDAFIFRGGREGLFASSAEVCNCPCFALMSVVGTCVEFNTVMQTGAQKLGRLWASCTWSVQWAV